MLDLAEYDLSTIQLTKLTQLERVQLRLSLEANERAHLEADCGAFFRASWEVLEPGRDLEWSWHYELFSEYASLIRSGRFKEVFPDAQGLIVNVPPRTAKSTFWTVCFPVWCWLEDASKRFLAGSYSGQLAVDHNVKRRDLIQSAWFRSRWPDKFQIKQDQNLKSRFDNDKTGQMFATSVGGSATGMGGDIIIIDDPLNPQQAASDTERLSANEWMDSTLRSRLNNQATGIIVVVMQRLHETDATGHLLSQGEHTGGNRWVHIAIPLEAEGVKGKDGQLLPDVYTFPVSKRQFVRPVGDVLYPRLFPPGVVDALRILRLVYAGQYQQRPSPLEGNMIKLDDIMYYGGVDPLTSTRDRELPDSFDMIMTSCDAAFKDVETSDFVAIGTIGVKGPNRFILEVTNNHLDVDGTIQECKRQRSVWGSQAVLVEDKANGPTVVKKLKLEIPGVIAMPNQDGKVARMFAACPEWQSHNWFVSRLAAWTVPFLAQIMKFPNAQYDDMADMMTQAAAWLQTKGMGLFGLWGQQFAAMRAAQQQAAETQAIAKTVEIVVSPEDELKLAQAQKEGVAGFLPMRPAQPKPTARANACPACGNLYPAEHDEGRCACVCGHKWVKERKASK